MIRTLVVDDHPAVVGGLLTALRAEPGFVPLEPASGVSEALLVAERDEPSVALVDYHLADGDGLVLCHGLKQLPAPPHVLIYSAFAKPDLALAARVAGAAGIADKGVPLNGLFDALRAVAAGRAALPELDPEVLKRAARRLTPEHLPILGMRFDGASVPEIAATLHLEERVVERRFVEIVRRLAQDVDATHRA